ncbi:MAG: hypothetical protein WBA89_05640 [Microcoleus sp.]|uniref:hypothetical protein n=1 Tax=Microcoleus sp. TaxID=44472 RepID=UPI003C79153B
MQAALKFDRLKHRNSFVFAVSLLRKWLLLTVDCWLLTVGCWLLAVGCWLLAVKKGGPAPSTAPTDCWLLAVGCWLLTVEC